MDRDPEQTFMVYPIQNIKCCDKRSIITTNDGNRKQKCINCGWKWSANKLYSK
jgi:hypothetical protein